MSNNEILQNQNKRRNLHSGQNNSVKNIMSSSDKMLPAARESMEHQQCISERAPNLPSTSCSQGTIPHVDTRQMQRFTSALRREEI